MDNINNKLKALMALSDREDTRMAQDLPRAGGAYAPAPEPEVSDQEIESLSSILDNVSMGEESGANDIQYKENMSDDDYLQLLESHEALKSENPYLSKMTEDLNKYSLEKFGKPLTLTEIARTQAQQEKHYDHLPKNQIKKSPHQFLQGVDIRSKDYTKDQIADMVKYMNEKYNESNYWNVGRPFEGKKSEDTLDYHKVGDGAYHFHLQGKEHKLPTTVKVKRKK